MTDKAPARTAPTMAERYELMTMVKAEYAKAELTDTEFARYATEALDRTVHPGTVANYREVFNIPPFKAPSAQEMRAKIRALQRELDLRDESAVARA